MHTYARVYRDWLGDKSSATCLKCSCSALALGTACPGLAVQAGRGVGFGLEASAWGGKHPDIISTRSCYVFRPLDTCRISWAQGNCGKHHLILRTSRMPVKKLVQDTCRMGVTPGKER